LSCVTYIFIVGVGSEFKPDPNKVIAALPHILRHMMDNTSFGNDVPTLPQWTGPPRAIVQVQAILLASLSASLLSIFLALFGKLWLNRYGSVDMRGSFIERCHRRQQKLDSIANWCFGRVMQYLPLILQGALLLLGFALSRHFWDIIGTVAPIFLGLHLVCCLLLFLLHRG
jgi:hypothetical protein